MSAVSDIQSWIDQSGLDTDSNGMLSYDEASVLGISQDEFDIVDTDG